MSSMQKSLTDVISIHAPHARSDLERFDSSPEGQIFQSTLLMRGATRAAETPALYPMLFQSTLLMRGATRCCNNQPVEPHISIHAPHARSDVKLRNGRPAALISIHAPHARSDCVTFKH